MHKWASIVACSFMLFSANRTLADTDTPAKAIAPADVKCFIDHAEIDGVTVKFGVPLKIVGRCIAKDSYDLNPAQVTLEIVRINGRGTQSPIVVYLSGLPEGVKGEAGKWYIATATLTGGNSARSWATFSAAATELKLTPAAPLTLGDFLDRKASFEGHAIAKTQLEVNGEKIAVADWPAEVVGKHVEARGVVRKDGTSFRFEKPDWRLTDLADLVGKTTTLEGRFWSLNGVWSFGYRGQSLIITDEKDRPASLGGRDGSFARVSGLLVNQLRPSLDQISLKTDRDLVPTYVVRRAKIEFPDPPISIGDRFRNVYPTGYKIVDDVPVLIAEGIVRRNIMGNESGAMGFFQRNIEVIDAVLKTATPKKLDVIASRLKDAAVDRTLKLVYATMLAASNDSRGGAFLTKAAENRGEGIESVLFSLGMVGFLMPDDSETKTDCRWIEPLLVKLMTERDADGDFTVAPFAVLYSSIPRLMMKLNTPATRKALIEYVLAKVDAPSNSFRPGVLLTLAYSEMPVSHEDLLRLEKAFQNKADRQSVLQIALRVNDAAAAALFFNELGEDNDFAGEFHEYLTPEIVAMLRDRRPALVPAAQTEARLLIILGQKDPVPELIGLLSDPTGKDKSFALGQLAKRKDPRAIAPVYKIFREGAADYFHRDQEDSWTKYRICTAIKAIACADAPEAVPNLIDLLGDDLTRFTKRIEGEKHYFDRASYQRVIAAHLIEMTGESFGTDRDAWRRWYDAKR